MPSFREIHPQFGQNDGTNIQTDKQTHTDRQTDIFFYVYRCYVSLSIHFTYVSISCSYLNFLSLHHGMGENEGGGGGGGGGGHESLIFKCHK